MILLIDSYDSFSNNLRDLLKTSTGKKVSTIYNDAFKPDEYEPIFHTWISTFDYIVIGPGPGHPANEADVGIIKWLLQYMQDNPANCVPVLGVCLGFQSICFEAGHSVVKLDDVKHGQIYSVQSKNSELFGENTPHFESVRYHSLHVQLSTDNDSIEVLATCSESSGKSIIMAGRHSSLPLYGVQYHPESVCSKEGAQLVTNFDKIASQYNELHRPDFQHITRNTAMDRCAVNEPKLLSSLTYGNETSFVVRKATPGPEVLPLDFCDNLSQLGEEFIFLNSASDPGEWSIIGLPDSENEVLTHSIDDPGIIRVQKYGSSKVKLVESPGVFEYLASEMTDKFRLREDLMRAAQLDKSEDFRFPFFGGYMGVFSYEEGRFIDSSDYESFTTGSTPDTKLIFIDRFVLYHRQSGAWFVCSSRNGDGNWASDIVERISNVKAIDVNSVPKSVQELFKPGDNFEYDLPSREIYKKQFDLCQNLLHSGDSYELCLTTQTKLRLPSHLDYWDIYKILVLHKNPSPFSCFMNFDDCVLISSSPERFLSWNDSEKKGCKKVELRPIKGTVRKDDQTSFEDAVNLLKTPKEMGENLMIVDLIRHDLFNLMEKVDVTTLMAVEEYKTVYQLVSVIRGELEENGYKGLDVLRSSLPPGSMTGAPKKRSVELLKKIEAMQPTINAGGRRGLYSGVAGYWSITDDADWSVVIRSLMHYKADKENSPDCRVWRAGAGGAITVLSTEEGEWEEMRLKLTSTLQTFS